MSRYGKIMPLLAVAMLVSAIGTALSGSVRPAGQEMGGVAALPNGDAWRSFRDSHEQAFRLAAGASCTSACQKKHDACYRDCEVRYVESTAAQDCKGACDGDKRLCRTACR